MAMIFHRFASPDDAERFAAAIARDYALATTVHLSEAASDDADPFPYALTPPIVHVERSDDEETERAVEVAVEAFGGRFAGT